MVKACKSYSSMLIVLARCTTEGPPWPCPVCCNSHVPGPGTPYFKLPPPLLLSGSFYCWPPIDLCCCVSPSSGDSPLNEPRSSLESPSFPSNPCTTQPVQLFDFHSSSNLSFRVSIAAKHTLPASIACLPCQAPSLSLCPSQPRRGAVWKKLHSTLIYQQGNSSSFPTCARSVQQKLQSPPLLIHPRTCGQSALSIRAAASLPWRFKRRREFCFFPSLAPRWSLRPSRYFHTSPAGACYLSTCLAACTARFVPSKILPGSSSPEETHRALRLSKTAGAPAGPSALLATSTSWERPVYAFLDPPSFLTVLGGRSISNLNCTVVLELLACLSSPTTAQRSALLIDPNNAHPSHRVQPATG